MCSFHICKKIVDQLLSGQKKCLSKNQKVENKEHLFNFDNNSEDLNYGPLTPLINRAIQIASCASNRR